MSATVTVITLSDARAVMAQLAHDMARHLGYALSASKRAADLAKSDPAWFRAAMRDAHETLLIVEMARSHAALLQERMDACKDASSVDVSGMPWLPAYHW